MGKRGVDGTDTSAPVFQFEFHSPDFDVPPDVQQYTRAKLEAKLAKFGKTVIAVIVRIKDENGSKGGVDKMCRMEALLAHMEPVNVVETHGDLRAVIDITIDHFEDALRRHIGKVKTKPRQQGRKLVRNRKTASP